MRKTEIKNKTRMDIILDLLVFLGVLVVTIYFILELLPEAWLPMSQMALVESFFYVNLFVVFIFALDLLRLYLRSESFKAFLHDGWIDILATIPLGLIGYMSAGSSPVLQGSNNLLKLARVEKIIKLERFSQYQRVAVLTRELKAAAKMKEYSRSYEEKKMEKYRSKAQRKRKTKVAVKK